MELLYFLEKIRVPGLNEFMLTITHLGAETAFLVIALILFWCIDKRQGYYVLTVGFIGTIMNQFLKLWFRVPRPFELDQDFHCLKAAEPGASGFSFPSGHTQSSVGTFGSIANSTNNKVLRALCIAIAIVVPFSRMYVGVHTPADVLVAAAIAIVLILAVKPVFYKQDGMYIPVVFAGMLAMAVGYLCFVELYHFPDNVNPERLRSGVESAYTLMGSLLGLLVVYIVDKRWQNFTTNAVLWAQIAKVILGLALVLAVKEGMRTPLNFLLGDMLGRMTRYFLVVLVSGFVWPLSFKWFSTLGCKE